jgi:hypothetical protein
MEISIDRFTFVLISKTVADNKGYITTHFQGDESIYNNPFTETRNKVIFESYPTGRNHEKKILYAYTSISELGLWRLCYIQGETLLKFDNYTQATLLHIKLQQFINDNFDKLPFATDTFSRKIIHEDIEIYGVDIPEYTEGINDYGAIACISPEDIDEENIENRYISFFPSSARSIKSKSDYFKDNGFKVESMDYLFTINVTLDDINVNMEMHRVTVSSNETIIMEIGKFNISHVVTKSGYYICNMIKSDEINPYGLYSNYISGTAINPPKGTEESYTAKPLEYIKQAKKYRDGTTKMVEQNLYHPVYEYMGYRRQDIFPITQLPEGKGKKKEKRKTKKPKYKNSKRKTKNKTSNQNKYPKKRKTRTVKKV